MSAVPTVFDHDQPPLPGEGGERLPKAAFAFYLLVGAAAIVAAGPFVAKISARAHGLDRVRDPGRRRGARATLRRRRAEARREQRGNALVPHDGRLPPAGGALARAAARRADPDRPARPRVAEEATALVHRDVQHLQLHADHPRHARASTVGARPRRPDPEHRTSASRPARLLACVVYVARQPLAARARCSASAAASLSRSPVSSPARRCPPSSSLAALGVAVAAFWHSNPWLIPLALAPLVVINRSLAVPALQDGGARRPEDGPLQRAPLRHRARRRADARAALRPAAVGDDGRPRSPARHQQQLRPPRRRRRPARDRRRLPRGAAPLRRACALRRRGVLDPAPRDDPGTGAGDRRTDPPGARRAQVRGRDVERADPGDRLDRRRGIPARRVERQRADPPGRPRGLPREAPGPQPRARGERRVAAAREGRSAPAARASFPSRRMPPAPPPVALRRPFRRRVRRSRLEAPATPRPHSARGPRFFSLSFRLAR